MEAYKWEIMWPRIWGKSKVIYRGVQFTGALQKGQEIPIYGNCPDMDIYPSRVIQY